VDTGGHRLSKRRRPGHFFHTVNDMNKDFASQRRLKRAAVCYLCKGLVHLPPSREVKEGDVHLCKACLRFGGNLAQLARQGVFAPLGKGRTG
jgi:hypothetical protein